MELEKIIDVAVPALGGIGTWKLVEVLIGPKRRLRGT